VCDCRVRENIELLKQRMQLIMDTRDELNHDLQKQIDLSHEYFNNINRFKPELKQLSKCRERLKK